MRQENLKDMSVRQLVARFAEIGVAQDTAERDDNLRLFTRLYRQADAVEAELRSRAPDQRRALLTLYQHKNMQVRLNAATATLKLAPDQARRALEAIHASNWYPQAGDAGMRLSNLDHGVFKPT